MEIDRAGMTTKGFSRGPRRRVGRWLLLVSIGVALLASACAGRRPEDLGLRDGLLSPCPSSPNCVSSDAADQAHLVAPIEIEGSAWDAWSALRKLLETTPRVRVVEVRYEYIRAEFTSLAMGYVDDVEFVLRMDEHAIAVRSASRLGYGDLGANRRRVEWVREELANLGHARPAPQGAGPPPS